MSTRPALTLVVPVYNVAPYLPRCLESLSVLTPPADEIIVVDDGSTDECPRILAEWATRLPTMRVIRQANGGLSAARNTGLDAATGDYLAFVDSDDFLEPDAYSRALSVIRDENLDMVLFNGDYHYEGRHADEPIYRDAADSALIPGKEWLRGRIEAGKLPHMVWLHLYRREFIEAQRFRFIPGLIHEDVVWTTQALLAARRVRYIEHRAVHYRIPVRQFTPEVRQAKLENTVRSSIYNARTLARLAESETDDAAVSRALSLQLVDGALSIFHLLAKMPDRSAALRALVMLRQEGVLGLLWRHAQTTPQRRRIARHWLRSWLWGIGK